MRIVSEIIKTNRLKKGISTKEFSKYLGISESMLSRIEGGNRKISSNKLNKVAKFLELPEREIKVHYLIDDIKNKFSKDSNFKEAIKRLSNEYN